MRYKVGDKVVVVKLDAGVDLSEYTKEQLESVIGIVGEIIKIDATYEFPYYLKFEDSDIEELDLNYWKEEELALLNKREEGSAMLWDEVAHAISNLNVRNLNIDSLKDLKEILETKVKKIKVELEIKE